MSGWKQTALILAFITLLPSQLSGPVATAVAITPPIESGLASFYGRDFHGKRTASGVQFDMTRMLAAHPTLPFGTVVRVTNVATRRSVNVTVVDRGPAHRLRKRGVIIDVSHAAAKALGFVREGRARVTLHVITRRPRIER